MSPAFSSARQAGVFAGSLLLILLLPVLAGKWALPTREQMYSSTGRGTIDFPHFHEQIFEEKGDIDMAIMGSSRLGCALDPAYLQEKLSEKLGRPAIVRGLTWTWNGYDALYFIAQDLLQRRKVRLLVISDLSYDLTPATGNVAHHQTSYWFRLADNGEALDGLPLKAKASFYASAILGIPRNLVGLLRPNLDVIPADPNATPWNHSPTDFTPHSGITAEDARVYSDATKAGFHFSDRPIPAMQLAFVRKLGRLAQQYHTKIVFVNLPDFADRTQALIEENTNWPDAFQADVSIVGIAPATLLTGLSDDDIRKLYYNPTHFNQNGQNYFTPLITPSLIQIYEEQAQP